MYRIFTYIHNFTTFPLQSSRNIKLTNSKYLQICSDCRKFYTAKYWSNFGAGRMYVHSPARHVTFSNIKCLLITTDQEFTMISLSNYEKNLTLGPRFPALPSRTKTCFDAASNALTPRQFAPAYFALKITWFAQSICLKIV